MMSHCRVKIQKSKRKDPAWVHGEILEGARTHWKCKYCNKIFKGGGISRLKMHIAGLVGDVVSCSAVPQEIREITKAEWEKEGKKQEPRKRKQNGMSKEVVTINESGPLQIGLATEDVPAPGNSMLALLEKQGKQCTPKRENKEVIKKATGRDAEKEGKKCKPVMEKQKETDKKKEREEETMLSKETGEVPATTGDC
jgi:BED zinc finger